MGVGVNIKNKKTKVTQVFRYAYPHIGGVEAVINQINDSLPNENFEKEVLCCSNTDKSSVENGVKYTRAKYLFEFASNNISPQLIWNLSRVKTDILVRTGASLFFYCKERGGTMMFKNEKEIERLKREYPAGCRIELVFMDDMQAPAPGTLGTVRGVDDAGDLLMRWDNGSSLKVVIGEDIIRKVG